MFRSFRFHFFGNHDLVNSTSLLKLLYLVFSMCFVFILVYFRPSTRQSWAAVISCSLCSPVISACRHPAHTVTVPTLDPTEEGYSMWKKHARIRIRYNEAMTCHRCAYDRHLTTTTHTSGRSVDHLSSCCPPSRSFLSRLAQSVRWFTVSRLPRPAHLPGRLRGQTGRDYMAYVINIVVIFWMYAM